jgi:Icc-related predicted phosphoesterase
MERRHLKKHQKERKKINHNNPSNIEEFENLKDQMEER